MSQLGRSFVVAMLVAGGHLGLSIYALGGASASDKGMGLWQGASRILGFPLVYLDRLNYGPHYELMPRMDVFSLLVVANSILWGVVVALLIHWISRRRRESRAR